MHVDPDVYLPAEHEEQNREAPAPIVLLYVPLAHVVHTIDMLAAATSP